jgi:hypothetical protein
MLAMVSERRRFSRRPAGVVVEYAGAPDDSSKTGTACSRNVSQGGLGVVLPEPYAVGAMLVFRFSLPSGEQVRASGRVAWVDEFDIGSEKAYDTGIEFMTFDKSPPAAGG